MIDQEHSHKGGQTRRGALASLVGAAAAPHVAAAPMAHDQAADLVLAQNIFVDVPLATAESSVAQGAAFKIVDSALGLASVYLRTADGSDYLFSEVTSAALGAANGAALVNSRSPNATVTRRVSERLNDAPETPQDFDAVGNGADDSESLTAWLNAGNRIHAAGDWKSESIIGVRNCALDLDIAAAGKLIFDQQDADSLVFENCTGRIGNLIVDETKETVGGVRGSIVFRNCKDLMIHRILTTGGKDLPVVMVESDNCHIIGGSGIGSDENRPFAWEMVGCSNSTIQRVRLSKYQHGFILIGPGYKSGTEARFMTSRAFEETLGMSVAYCDVDNHTGHAFDANGVVGGTFHHCFARHYTGDTGNAAFQFKQSTNLLDELPDATWGNVASECIAFDQVSGFATQHGAHATFRDCIAHKVKRHGGYANSTRNVVWDNFTVRDWGLDLINWPALNEEGTCAAIAILDGSDQNSVRGLSAEITAEEGSAHIGVLSLVSVSGAICDVDGISLKKFQSGTILAGLVITGPYCRIGFKNRLTSSLFTGGTGIRNTSPNTIYPLNFSKVIELSAGTYTLDADIPAGLMVGRVSARKGSSTAVTGEGQFVVGYRGSNTGLVAARACPTTDVAEIAPLVSKSVPNDLYLVTQVIGSELTGAMIVTVSGIPNV